MTLNDFGRRISNYVFQGTYRNTALGHLLTSPEGTLVGSFAFVILIGTLLLLLPWSQAPGKVNFVDALFTSTSAVCVTGLTVVDTANDFTLFGRFIIMLLIQVGGLGTMTLAAMAILLAGRRLSLRSQALVSDTFFQHDVGAEFRVSFSHILILTFAVETIGAVFLFFAFLQYMDPSSAAFSAVFHAVSAFCNAGFSDHSLNIVQFRDSVTIITVISSLIVLGGLGYMVLHEVWRVFVGAVRNMQLRRKARLSLHTRVVLVITPLLLFWGAAGLLLCGMTSDETGVSDGILHAFFQSVSARTAGFNSVDIGKLPAASLFVLIMLMFVGGSPASCAGGIKTTSLGLWVARLYASVHGRKEVRLLDRSVPEDLLNRAELLLGLAILWNLVGILIMLTTQSHLQAPAIDLIFEQISAFGTVGLSTGVTAKLSVTGKLWISLTMFVGRTGPLTVALWMFQRDNAHIGYPKGTVMIG